MVLKNGFRMYCNDEKSYYQAIKIETTKTMLNYLVISAAVSHRVHVRLTVAQQEI